LKRKRHYVVEAVESVEVENPVRGCVVFNEIVVTLHVDVIHRPQILPTRTCKNQPFEGVGDCTATVDPMRYGNAYRFC
jgi:hypothetical protein